MVIVKIETNLFLFCGCATCTSHVYYRSIWVVSNLFHFHPDQTGENNPVWLAHIFQMGWNIQPPTRIIWPKELVFFSFLPNGQVVSSLSIRWIRFPREDLSNRFPNAAFFAPLVFVTFSSLNMDAAYMKNGQVEPVMGLGTAAMFFFLFANFQPVSSVVGDKNIPTAYRTPGVLLFDVKARNPLIRRRKIVAREIGSHTIMHVLVHSKDVLYI